MAGDIGVDTVLLRVCRRLITFVEHVNSKADAARMNIRSVSRSQMSNRRTVAWTGESLGIRSTRLPLINAVARLSTRDDWLTAAAVTRWHDTVTTVAACMRLQRAQPVTHDDGGEFDGRENSHG
jgi:hypothetical protein